MKKVIIDGGAGRIIAAIPALEKFVLNNPDDEITILVSAWDTVIWGNKLLQDKVFNSLGKGVFDQFIKPADVLISPEPYRLPSYYRQEKSLAEAFDEILNETNDHSDLGAPQLHLSLAEKLNATNIFNQIKQQQPKPKTIVIQPYGSTAHPTPMGIVDESSRSLSQESYIKLVNKLHKKYTTIYFGEDRFNSPQDPGSTIQGDIRVWASIIDLCDYFVGIDSLGQHIARALDKPGMVILGSTFAVNTSYPDYFNIWEKPGVEKFYSPLRLAPIDENLANRMNEDLLELSDNDIEDIYQQIVNDIESK